jgi:predicted alpha/beta superfamily hydrolase
MSETLRETFRRVIRRENRRTAVRPGRLERIHGFASSILGNSRQVTIYLPAGYDERGDQRYPVLYMQDGQNLFDSERAFIPGQHWRMQEAADKAIGSRGAAPMIIVGIDNAGVARIDEYTPTPDRRHKGGGRADQYGRMLVEELKPRIDAEFRTLGDRWNTAVGGSSLGGLLAMHTVLKRSDVFGRAIVMSPSVWWNQRVILQEVDAYNGPRPRLWLDIGSREGQQALGDARLLRDHLWHDGWSEENFKFYEDRRGDHSERAWARRIRQALEFLFPPA